jgi:hypothetical protein
MNLFIAAAHAPAGRVGRPTHELALHEALLDAAPQLLPRPRFERVAILEFGLRGSRPDVVSGRRSRTTRFSPTCGCSSSATAISTRSSELTKLSSSSSRDSGSRRTSCHSRRRNLPRATSKHSAEGGSQSSRTSDWDLASCLRPSRPATRRRSAEVARCKADEVRRPSGGRSRARRGA